MFECNDKDNNLLLILGIGIIVLILLKLFYSNNDKVKKQYRNLNYENNYENNYEDFEADTKYVKDFASVNPQEQKQTQAQAQAQAQAQVQEQKQPQTLMQAAQSFLEPKSLIQAAQSLLQSPSQTQGQQSQAAQIQARAQAQVAALAAQTQSQSQSQSQQNKQLSISVPIIDDSIFNPNKIEFDYGDANNLNYTLDTGDIKNKQEKLNSSDLLPTKSDQKWFENPDVGIKIEDANLLSDAVQKVGVDTVGQTRKNPSYDIRGTVPCPKFQISPWNNSTTEPDYNLKSLY
jgi:hypothetical protein